MACRLVHYLSVSIDIWTLANWRLLYLCKLISLTSEKHKVLFQRIYFLKIDRLHVIIDCVVLVGCRVCSILQLALDGLQCKYLNIFFLLPFRET